MIAVDTNILLRYLLEPLDARNPSKQVVAARQLIDHSEAVLITDVVIAELEWVLESVFELNRVEISSVVKALSHNSRFKFENWDVLQRALLDYSEHSHVDLSDCLIARKAQQQGATTLYTFERKQGLGGLSSATTLVS